MKQVEHMAEDANRTMIRVLQTTTPFPIVVVNVAGTTTTPRQELCV
jgi:hypothetical protein